MIEIKNDVSSCTGVLITWTAGDGELGCLASRGASASLNPWKLLPAALCYSPVIAKPGFITAAFSWASSKNIFLIELSTLSTVDHTNLPEFSATERIGYKIIFLCRRLCLLHSGLNILQGLVCHIHCCVLLTERKFGVEWPRLSPCWRTERTYLLSQGAVLNNHFSCHAYLHPTHYSVLFLAIHLWSSIRKNI